MVIPKFFTQKRDLSDEFNNGGVDNKRTHRLENPKQNKNKPRPVTIKFYPQNFRWKISLNKMKLRNTAISITGSLTTKLKKKFGFQKMWFSCLSYGKNLWHEFFL